MENATQPRDCKIGREPRHNQLLNVVGQLSSIRLRLNDLKLSLGVVQPEVKGTADCPTEADPCNLVDTMNRLPSMISVEINDIQQSIDELTESLI